MSSIVSGDVATISVGGSAVGVLVIVGIAFFILTVVAYVKIISKAGYSGAWVLVLFAPAVAFIITLAVLRHDGSIAQCQVIGTNLVCPPEPNNLGGLAVLDGLAYLVPTVFFFIFAFSRWPVLREVARLQYKERFAQGPGWPTTGVAPPGFGGLPPGATTVTAPGGEPAPVSPDSPLPSFWTPEAVAPKPTHAPQPGDPPPPSG